MNEKTKVQLKALRNMEKDLKSVEMSENERDMGIGILDADGINKRFFGEMVSVKEGNDRDIHVRVSEREGDIKDFLVDCKTEEKYNAIIEKLNQKEGFFSLMGTKSISCKAEQVKKHLPRCIETMMIVDEHEETRGLEPDSYWISEACVESVDLSSAKISHAVFSENGLSVLISGKVEKRYYSDIRGVLYVKEEDIFCSYAESCIEDGKVDDL